MTKAAYVCIGIGKEAKTIVLTDLYYLSALMEKLPTGTSVSITTTDGVDRMEDINEMLGIKEEEV